MPLPKPRVTRPNPLTARLNRAWEAEQRESDILLRVMFVSAMITTLALVAAIAYRMLTT